MLLATIRTAAGFPRHEGSPALMRSCRGSGAAAGAQVAGWDGDGFAKSRWVPRGDDGAHTEPSGQADRRPYQKCHPRQYSEDFGRVAATVRGMLTILSLLLVRWRSGLRGRAVLRLENLSRRHQVMMLERKQRGRPTLRSVDRLLTNLDDPGSPPAQTGAAPRPARCYCQNPRQR